MNIVLSIEAIRPPLAGIGRYAWELATRLPLCPEVDSVRYMADGIWRLLPALQVSSGTAVNVRKPSQRQPLRHHLGRLPLVARVYEKMMPVLAARRLHALPDSIFHSPNYFVPKTDLRSVVTVHDLSGYRDPSWHPKARVQRMRMAIPQSVARADVVITDSEAVRLEVIEEFSLAPVKVKTVPLGVTAEYYPRHATQVSATLSQYGLAFGEYSLFVSMIEPRKNIIHLLRAYKTLPVMLRKRWPLVIVGGVGWHSEDIHAEITRASNEGWVKYLGFVDESLLPALYAGARLFTYPSWYEGFGLPIVEAMASGVPVLTSNCSCMPEVAGGAAMLVEPADVVSIRDGLMQALEDEVWRMHAVTAGLQQAAALTWDACIAKTVDVYRSIGVR